MTLQLSQYDATTKLAMDSAIKLGRTPQLSGYDAATKLAMDTGNEVGNERSKEFGIMQQY
jgi:hypothetical protein